jgi:hypothetical protein
VVSSVGLPESYGENRLVLLVQEPVVLFAYWELSDAHWRSIREYGNGPYLRLLETGSEPAPQHEILLPSPVGGWYFRGLTPGGSYRVQIGYYSPDRVIFYPVLCSNGVNTPQVPGRHSGKRSGNRWFSSTALLKPDSG